jgi:hypothetical protein
MGKLLRRGALSLALTIAAVFTFGQPARASENSGWIYTSNESGAVYFDADLAGWPGYEKITVCDNKSDGRGIVAYVTYYYAANGTTTVEVRDPSNDGDCASTAGNFFIDEKFIYIIVFEYGGTDDDDHANWGYAWS